MRKYRRYVIFLIVIILATTYFSLSLGEVTTAYAQTISTAKALSDGNNYVGRNTRMLFGLILAGVVIFGAVKGWRRVVVLSAFLLFLGFASYLLFSFGTIIAPWLNSSGSKFIPVVLFFVGGIFCINFLYKIYTKMNYVLKKHLYKK